MDYKHWVKLIETDHVAWFLLDDMYLGKLRSNPRIILECLYSNSIELLKDPSYDLMPPGFFWMILLKWKYDGFGLMLMWLSEIDLNCK